MEDNIKELTLLLMYLTSWEEKVLSYNEEKKLPEEINIKSCWKGYDFDVLNELTDNGYLYPGKHKSKSVTFTKEGEILAQQLIEKYIK